MQTWKDDLLLTGRPAFSSLKSTHNVTISQYLSYRVPEFFSLRHAKFVIFKNKNNDDNSQPR